jgi:glycosyltransferase involved in cell wall biosynthesis
MRLPCFAHAHGYDVTRRKLEKPSTRWRYRRLRAATGIILMSEISRQRLLAACDLDPARLHVIPYGVDVPTECPRREDSEIVRCISVGRKVEKKNPMATLRAFLLAQREQNALRLEFVGGGPCLSRAADSLRKMGSPNT